MSKRNCDPFGSFNPIFKVDAGGRTIFNGGGDAKATPAKATSNIGNQSINSVESTEAWLQSNGIEFKVSQIG